MTRTSLAIAALLLSIAPAFPASDDTKIHMVCSGNRGDFGKRTMDENSVLSLAVEMNARAGGTVTIGGSYPPMAIMPETSPGASDMVLHFLGFYGPGTNHPMGGFLNRVTGELFVSFNENAPKGKEELFTGTCKRVQKLF
jgi:hypothetical protein